MEHLASHEGAIINRAPHSQLSKILIVSDAWLPQINGVVRTLAHLKSNLESRGFKVNVIGPDRFRSIACPTYDEIRLSVDATSKLSQHISVFAPDAIHIATEGPLGWTARHLCIKKGLPYTSAFHTRFPEYLRARLPIPVKASYSVLRRFHSSAMKTLVPTHSIAEELRSYGFKNLHVWSRGVERRIFRPYNEKLLEHLPKPIQLYVGRVAVEKNIEDFLKLKTKGSKVIIGDGPARAELERRYPEAHFLGVKKGPELAQLYSSADVFVFPSRSDTFGIVLIEALACGLPIAAYPVPGPKDIVHSKVGVLVEDLELAIKKALALSRKECAEYGATFSWEKCADIFLQQLHLIQHSGRFSYSSWFS